MGRPRRGVDESAGGRVSVFLESWEGVFTKSAQIYCKFAFYAFFYYIFFERVSDFRLTGESLPLKDLGEVTPSTLPYAHIC